MYAEKKHSLLIVLQGLDACGKDGVIRHILSGMNPAGCRVVGFKRPKPEELDHDFLWRVHPHLPGEGRGIGFQSIALRGCARGARSPVRPRQYMVEAL